MAKTKEPKRFTFSLTIFERLLFLNLYPKKGDYTSQQLFDALNQRIITDEERFEMYQIKNVAVCKNKECTQLDVDVPYDAREKILACEECEESLKPTTAIHWRTKDDEGNEIPQEKAIVIGEMAYHNICKMLKELDEAGALEQSHKSLYRKIVLGLAEEPELNVDELLMMELPPEDKEKKPKKK